MRKRITSSLLLVSILAFIVLSWQVTPVHAAAENGQISGQVLDGTNNNAPVGGQDVTLQLAQGSNSRDAGTVKTDARGRFTFSKLATDQTITYVVYTRYQGAQYVSNAVTLNQKAAQTANVQVYEATTSTDNVAVVRSTVLMRQDDPAKGVINVSQAFSFQNLNKKTYVGSLNASKGKPNALLFSLPAGVRNITLGSGFSGYQVIQVNQGFATDAALLPGTNEFSYSYEVPYTGSTYTFPYETQYPTVSLSVLVDPALHASSKDLTSSGIVNADNRAYHAFSATVLPAHKQVAMSLEGLAVPASHAGSPSFNAATIWLIVGVLVLVAIVAMTWFLFRSQHKRVATQQKLDASEQTDKTTSKALVADNPEQALLQELLKLDKEYEAGNITRDRYEKQRARTKARLRSLMSEKETTRR
ncbi:carboxypeptidase-like regulatory domain-containing protein [Dictyobacter aurantiacus]|uniref:Carboxypeptidase regulatory-like domain-containing protein n=1 Tax=Dictyobacter aurantiacus TaxID=1936993 RepID=A0A401ZBL7_9CHLR|nr:carboxypeptidase-like regulatory domain-containing protein [Dictyobacter aurantiacus]GCE04280.1 hypothetical protein KDAU_16090 [Dictyobacter aurantiacus]